MKQGSADIPVAYCLPAGELRDRETKLLAQFKSAVMTTDELPDGYSFRLPGGSEVGCGCGGIDCGRAGMLPLFDIRVGCPPQHGASDRPGDWP